MYTHNLKGNRLNIKLNNKFIFLYWIERIYNYLKFWNIDDWRRDTLNKEFIRIIIDRSYSRFIIESYGLECYLFG